MYLFELDVNIAALILKLIWQHWFKKIVKNGGLSWAKDEFGHMIYGQGNLRQSRH